MKCLSLIMSTVCLLACLAFDCVADNNEIGFYEKSDLYQMVLIDVNNDKIKDKIFYSKPYDGDQLIIFINKDGCFHKSLETINFSEDGGVIIEDIVKANDDVNVFIIKTFFPNGGTYNRHFYIAYHMGEWMLTKIVTTKVYWQKDSEKKEVCVAKLDFNLENINADNKDFFVTENSSFNESKECYNVYQFEEGLIDISRSIMNKDISQISDVDRYRQLFVSYPLTKSNVLYYNNIAFFLEQRSLYAESIFILENVIENFPSRVVAYVNLGDAYWKYDHKDKAIEAYHRYIELMTKTEKTSLIPKRVFERIGK